MKEQRNREGRVRGCNEIFTPAWMVEFMLDSLEKENPGQDVFRPGSVIGDLTGCGEGAFLTGILRRKLMRCKGPEDILESLRNLYGIDIQGDNVQISREAVLAMVSPELDAGQMAEARAIVERNIVAGNCLTKLLNTGEPIPWLKEDTCST